MALLDWISQESALVVDGELVRLRPPRSRDYAPWRELRNRSRDFLQPWEPTWPADDLTRPGYRRRLAAYARDRELAQAYAFFVYRVEDDALVGGVTLSNIRRGVAQMGTIGYWVGQPYARKGYTLEAVRQIGRFAFEVLGLHRIEAACVPENQKSRSLLLKAGFQEEGKAAAYLKINGVWRDHLLFGMLTDVNGRAQNL